MSEDFSKRPKKRRSSILKPSTDQNIIRTETTISRRVSFSRSKNVQEYIVGNPPVESAYAESYFDDISSLRHTEDEDSKALSIPSSIESESSHWDKSIFTYRSNETDLDIIQKSINKAASDGFPFKGKENDVNTMHSMNMEMTRIGDEDFVDNIEDLISQEAEKSFAILDSSHDKDEGPHRFSHHQTTIREPCGMDITTMFSSETKVYTQEEYNNKENRDIRSRHVKKVSTNRTLRESMGMDFTIAANDQLNTTHKNKTLRESMGMDLTVVDHNDDSIKDGEEKEEHYNTESHIKSKTLRESVGMELTMNAENNCRVDEDLDTNPFNNPRQRNKTIRESIGMNFTMVATNTSLVDEDSNPNVIHKSPKRNKTLRESIGMDMTMGVENNSSMDEDINLNSNLIQKHYLKDRTLRESVGMNMTMGARNNFSVEKDITSKAKFVHKQSPSDVAMNVKGVEGVNSKPNFHHKSSQNKTQRESVEMNMTISAKNHIEADEDTDSILNLIYKQSQNDKTTTELIGMNTTMNDDNNSSFEEGMEMDHIPNKIHNPSKRNKTVRESIGMDFTIAGSQDSSIGEVIDPRFKTTKYRGQSECLNFASHIQSGQETELETSIQISKERQKETIPMDILNESSLDQNCKKLPENIDMECQNRLIESHEKDIPMTVGKVHSKNMTTNLVEVALSDSAPSKELRKVKISLNKSESIKANMKPEVYVDSRQSCQSTNPRSEENEINIESKTLKSQHSSVNPLETLFSSEEHKMMETEVSSDLGLIETSEKIKEDKNDQIQSMNLNKCENLNGDDSLSEGQIKKRKVAIDEECDSLKNVIGNEVDSPNFDSEMLANDSSKNGGRASNHGESMNGSGLVEPKKMERTENCLHKDIADFSSKVDNNCSKIEFCDPKGKSSNIPISILDNPRSGASNFQKSKLTKSEQNSESLVSVREVNLNETQNTSMNDTQESNWISQVETPPCNNRLSGLYSVNSAESSFSDTYNSFRIESSVENTPQSKESKSTMETINVFKYYEREQLNFNDNHKYADYSIISLSDDAALLSFMQGKFILTCDIEPLDFVEDKVDCSVSHWTVKQIHGQIHYTKNDPFVNLVLDLVDELFHQNRVLTDACRTTMSFKDFLGYIRPQISNACMMIINETKIFHSHPCSGLDSKSPRIYLIHFSGFCFNFSVEINFQKGLDLIRDSVSCTVSEGPVNANFILSLASKSKGSWMFFKDYIKNVDLYVKHMDFMYLKSLGLVS